MTKPATSESDVPREYMGGVITSPADAAAVASNPASAVGAAVSTPAWVAGTTGGAVLSGGGLAGVIGSPLAGFVRDYGGAVLNVRSPSAQQNPASSPAAGDGVTNDSPRIGNVIYYGMPGQGAQAGYIDVLIPPATPGSSNYQIATNPLGVNTVSNYRLRGPGRDVATLKLANAANINMFDYAAGGLSGISVEDITFDGNKANQTSAGSGVQFTQFTNSLIRNVQVKNTYGAGIRLSLGSDHLLLGVEIDSSGKTTTSDGSGAGIYTNANRVRIIGARVSNPNDTGILLGGDMNAVVGSIILNPYWIGIAGGTTSTRNTITANAVAGSIASHGIDIGSSQDTIVSSNAINNCFGGFSSDTGTRQVWVGNIVRLSTGTGGGANGSGGIMVGGGAAGTATYLGNHTYLFSSTLITNPNNHGLAWDGMRGEILIANTIIKNAAQLTVGAAAIRLSATNNALGNVLLIGNKFYDDQTVKTQAYALDIAATIYHVSAIHNDFRGNKNGAINDAGTATYTHGNLGYNPRGFLVAPAPAATGVILYNPFNCDCMVYINGSSAAALTAIAVGGIATPVNATHVGLITGGTLAAGTYWYRVSALNPQGETLASTETSVVVASGTTGSVLVRWTAVPGATGYNVYGRTTGAELKMVTNVQATTFLDDGSVTPSGALPGADTTGNTVLTGWTAAPANDSVIAIYLPWGNGIKVTYTTFVTANWQWFGL